MRIFLLILLVGLCSALAMEALTTDESRTRASAAVFTGRVVSTKFVRELEVGALWQAVIQMEKIHKADQLVATKAVVYFEQMYLGPIGTNGFGCHGYACPRYPDIKLSQKAKFWCPRSTIHGLTNVLFIPWAAWVESQ